MCSRNKWFQKQVVPETTSPNTNNPKAVGSVNKYGGFLTQKRLIQ